MKNKYLEIWDEDTLSLANNSHIKGWMVAIVDDRDAADDVIATI